MASNQDHFPENAPALSAQAHALRAQGKFAEARVAAERATRVSPRLASAWFNLGAAVAALGDAEAGIAAYRRALELDPGYAEAWSNLGSELGARGERDAEINAYRRALAIKPGLAPVWSNLAGALCETGEFEEAVAACRRAVGIDPVFASGWANLAAALLHLYRLDEAEAACRRALELNPRLAQGWSTLGVVLQDGGRTGEALDAHQRALSLDPANPAIPRNLGVALRDAGRYEEARDAYRRALALAPSYADAHINYAMLSLALGEYDEGWRSYRYRPARVQAVAAREKLAAGLPAEVGGRTILLLGEQGIGDELFFLRFAPSLKERGARLGCQCDRKIGTLLARTGIFDVVCDHEEARPPAQLEVLVGDLPLAPRRSGPLVAPLRLGALDARVEAMRRRLAGLGPAPYLGLTWRAGTPLSEQRRVRDRSLYKEIPLDLLARAVADFPGTILVLQRHPRAQEPGRLQQALGRAVHDVSPANEDLEDMLALLSLVDEYVGVSNTNMHLMAGLGRSARVLVPHPPEWRWMARGDASPWFPGFPVYRQQGGDWADALARLAGDLRRSLASRP